MDRIGTEHKFVASSSQVEMIGISRKLTLPQPSGRSAASPRQYRCATRLRPAAQFLSMYNFTSIYDLTPFHPERLQIPNRWSVRVSPQYKRSTSPPYPVLLLAKRNQSAYQQRIQQHTTVIILKYPNGRRTPILALPAYAPGVALHHHGPGLAAAPHGPHGPQAPGDAHFEFLAALRVPSRASRASSTTLSSDDGVDDGDVHHKDDDEDF